MVTFLYNRLDVFDVWYGYRLTRNIDTEHSVLYVLAVTTIMAEGIEAVVKITCTIYYVMDTILLM